MASADPAPDPKQREAAGDRVQLRRGTAADARAAAELWIRSRRASAGAIPQPVHPADDVHAWFASHVVVNAELWVAEDETGALVAIMVLDGGWLEQLYVDPGATGRGIGTRLLEHAMRLRPHGLRLWTFPSNVGARRFYERHDFVQAGRTEGSGNEEGAPDILYVWPSGSLQRQPVPGARYVS